MIQQTLLALSDPTRRQILKLLRRGDKTAGEISERFDVSPPAISRHLTVLKEAQLVSSRRDGKFIYYSLTLDLIEELRDWLSDFLREEA